jgi:hypothetical protein
MKSWKTTLVGIVCLINVAACLVIVVMKIATITDVGAYVALSTPVILGIGNFFAKDSDVTGGTRQQ